MFTSLVAKNRDMEQKAVVAAGALTYYSENAISIGFADREETLSAALASFRNKGKTGDSNMTTQNAQPAATAPAAPVDTNAIRAEAMQAERARFSAILGCEEAKGRMTTANALAAQGVTLETAKAILLTVPAEGAKAETAPGAGFNAAMESTRNPNVAAEGGKGGDAEAEQRNHADAVLAAMASETGIDYKKRA
jgi:hypothetical protein